MEPLVRLIIDTPGVGKKYDVLRALIALDYLTSEGLPTAKLHREHIKLIHNGPGAIGALRKEVDAQLLSSNEWLCRTAVPPKMAYATGFVGYHNLCHEVSSEEPKVQSTPLPDHTCVNRHQSRRVFIDIETDPFGGYPSTTSVRNISKKTIEKELEAMPDSVSVLLKAYDEMHPTSLPIRDAILGFGHSDIQIKGVHLKNDRLKHNDVFTDGNKKYYNRVAAFVKENGMCKLNHFIKLIGLPAGDETKKALNTLGYISDNGTLTSKIDGPNCDTVGVIVENVNQEIIRQHKQLSKTNIVKGVVGGVNEVGHNYTSCNWCRQIERNVNNILGSRIQQMQYENSAKVISYACSAHRKENKSIMDAAEFVVDYYTQLQDRTRSATEGQLPQKVTDEWLIKELAKLDGQTPDQREYLNVWTLPPKYRVYPEYIYDTEGGLGDKEKDVIRILNNACQDLNNKCSTTEGGMNIVKEVVVKLEGLHQSKKHYYILHKSQDNSTTTKEKENNMSIITQNDIEALKSLASVNDIDDDLSVFTSATSYAPAELQAVFKEAEEAEKKAKMIKAVDALRKTIAQATEVKKARVEEIRQLRRKQKELTSYVQSVELALAYGAETMNYLPLANLLGEAFVTGPKAAVPEGWTPTNTEKAADKEEPVA